jgi:hypothetical protein
MKLFYTLLLILFGINFSYAWVYPEHRQIAILAIQNLSPEYRSFLDKLWAEARVGYESRLSEKVIDTSLTVNPKFLDYASWSAISGDHSCSAENMLHIVLNSEWILDVADVAAELKIELAKAKTRDQIINSLRNSDLLLQRADVEYATRAGSNNVHFLLARPDVETDGHEYLIACLSEGGALNAISAYTLYHVSALLKAARLANGDLTSEERSALTLSALADESFALHFLEDIFASGHVAGTWGDASQRKGTHDYYNEQGLEVTTWDGKRIVLAGDAYMRPKDAEFAAIAVRLSIEQLLDVASGMIPSEALVNNDSVIFTPNSFNVCKINYLPEWEVDSDFFNPLIIDVLVQTPVPGLADGLGELPRFRAELGMFIGVVPAIYSTTVSGGFGVNQTTPGFVAGLEAAVRFGIGLEGVLNESGDGLIFLDLGWQQNAASTMNFGDSPGLVEGGTTITAAIPGRDALSLRLRMPFWLLPLDMLILAPVLALTSPNALVGVGTQAVNGGLIPWQSGIATSIGRFQFILGREFAVTFYGIGVQQDAIIIPTDDTQVGTLVTYKSTKLEFPIVEYRPFRTFSLDQSSSLVFQLLFGVDIPHGESVVVPPGASVPDLRAVWYIGLRTAFDWRHYF